MNRTVMNEQVNFIGVATRPSNYLEPVEGSFWIGYEISAEIVL